MASSTEAPARSAFLGERWHRPASLVGLIGLWGLAAVLVGDALFPGPAQVAGELLRQVAAGELLFHVGVTLGRVAVSFVLAMLAGCAVGVAMGLWPTVNRLADGLLLVLLNVPALVTIILCYVWLGLTETAAVLAVAINKTPMVAVNMREGARVLDPAYAELARVYRFGRWKTLRHVVVPQLAPYLLASTRNGLALIWKIVLVVELLGRSNGVGFKLQLYFQLFRIDSLLAYSIAFIVCVLAIEFAVLQPLEKRISRWQR
ncbi:ABC transporter permease [Rhodovibrio sodomensis]|uniref:ABC transporter permease n=1 Tax=Rhodovibrio sodomensis TaxID=1088 RepID=A0ABS1DEK6_9PROT|nr:ABC transporter permease [Rhodovibrio sodomensis]MBK1668537.1 ABC transporter permease [Rhodovibrio sodomensis]